MLHAVAATVDALRAARTRLGLSQRALGAKVGLPQSHISKIEGGGSDLKLSSLTELARALDLELMLIPRKLVPAVEGVMRSAPGAGLSHSREHTAVIERARRAAAKLTRRNHDLTEVQRFAQTINELARFNLAEQDLAVIRQAADRLHKLPDDKRAPAVILDLTGQLRALRNRLVHALPEAPRPAYALDEADDDV